MPYNAIDELNKARPEQAAWRYSGDVNILHGGTAIRINRLFGYADVVEMVELFSATNDADGLVMLEKGTVILDRLDLAARNRLRSAMQSVDITMAGLIRDYPNDRDQRLAELARAKWIYGEADRESTIIRFDAEDAESNDPNIWRVDDDVDGEAGVLAAFIDALD